MENQYCPHCGSAVASGSERCPTCGAVLLRSSRPAPDLSAIGPANGRDGGARSSDGHLDIKLPEPHPAAEQLFGAAWSACCMGAIELAAAQRKVKLPAGLPVDAQRPA